MIKLLIFDLDGTLVNSLGDLKFCMNKMLKEYNLEEVNDDEVISFIGYGSKKFVELSMKGKRLELLDDCFKTYSKYLTALSGEKAYVYDGLDELLTTLKCEGRKLSIVSNKPQDATDVVVFKLLSKYNFDEVCGIREGFKPKPDVTAVNYVLNKFGVKKEEVLYVGDSETDMITANNAGLNAVGVLWGFRTKAELQEKGAKVFANNAKELYEIILKKDK